MKFLGTLLAAIAAVGLWLSVFTVNEQEQALVLQFGQVVDTVNEVAEPDPGLHFKLPWQQVRVFDRRNLELDMDAAEIQASDQVRLVVDAFLRYRIVDTERFYESVRDERIGANRLEGIMTNSLRAVIASIPSSDVISGQRAELMNRIQVAVENQVEAGNFGIEVIDVRILRADLPQAIADGVFNRMRSVRAQEAEAKRAQGRADAAEIQADANRQATVIVAEAERQAQQIRGLGDAQRNSIYAAAYGRDAEFFNFYRSMQAYEVAIQNGTPIVIPPDSEFFEYFSSQTGQ